MSLLWPKPLRISLASDRLVLRANRARNRTLALAPSASEAPWRAAVDALPGILGGFEKHQASIVLADQFVRYALLPWNATLRSEAQWLALARHRLAAVHGAAAADWEVRLTATAPSGPRLACAVDRGLLAELSAKFATAGVRLASVQPFLVAAFNRIRNAIGERSCWLVIEEPGRLTLALILRGTWTMVRSRRADRGWRGMLPALLERETALLALSEPCMQVMVCAQGEFDPEPQEPWRTEAVDYGELALAAEPA